MSSSPKYPLKFIPSFTVSPITAPVRVGYNFLGWYEGEKLVSEVTNKNYNLVAKWEKEIVKYTISYDTDGGGGTFESQSNLL